MHPSAHRFAADLDAITLLENLFLPIEREVIAVFAEEDVEDQARRGIAVFYQSLRCRSDQGSDRAVIDPFVFIANGDGFEEARRRDIKLFRSLFADLYP